VQEVRTDLTDFNLGAQEGEEGELVVVVGDFHVTRKVAIGPLSLNQDWLPARWRISMSHGDYTEEGVRD